MLPDGGGAPVERGGGGGAAARGARRIACRSPPAGAQSSTTGASITDRGVLLSLRALARIGRRGHRRAHDSRRRGRAGGRRAPRRGARGAAVHARPDERGGEHGRRRDRLQRVRRALAALRRHAPARARAHGGAGERRDAVRCARPDLEKNTVGYPMAHDPVDWFVGSEGTLGVVVEAELALLPLPARTMGLAIPFAREADALAFVVAARAVARGAIRAAWSSSTRCAMAIARGAEGTTSWAAGCGGDGVRRGDGRGAMAWPMTSCRSTRGLRSPRRTAR